MAFNVLLADASLVSAGGGAPPVGVLTLLTELTRAERASPTVGFSMGDRCTDAPPCGSTASPFAAPASPPNQLVRELARPDFLRCRGAAPTGSSCGDEFGDAFGERGLSSALAEAEAEGTLAPLGVKVGPDLVDGNEVDDERVLGEVSEGAAGAESLAEREVEMAGAAWRTDRIEGGAR